MSLGNKPPNFFFHQENILNELDQGIFPSNFDKANRTLAIVYDLVYDIAYLRIRRNLGFARELRNQEGGELICI